MRIKLCPADITFSRYIRVRDRECQRCHSKVEFNGAGLPKSHECSHYFGRGKEGTRFDPQNCDTLCMGCHKIWGSDDKEGYRSFKVKQMGEQEFQLMNLRAWSYCKKDRKLANIIAKELLKSELEKYEQNRITRAAGHQNR